MNFINPRTDFAFKKIFGSKESKPILISCLNAILHGGEGVIVDLRNIDPYYVPRLEGMKAAKEYVNQLQKGIDYELLNPVIALTLTDFIKFDDKELKNQIISRFALLEKEKLVIYPEGDVELVFVELPKFNLELEELTTTTEKWLYFLRQAPSLDVVPESLGAIPEIEQAFAIGDYAGSSREEERALDKKLQWLTDQKNLREENRELASSIEEKDAALEGKRYSSRKSS